MGERGVSKYFLRTRCPEQKLDHICPWKSNYCSSLLIHFGKRTYSTASNLFSFPSLFSGAHYPFYSLIQLTISSGLSFLFFFSLLLFRDNNAWGEATEDETPPSPAILHKGTSRGSIPRKKRWRGFHQKCFLFSQKKKKKATVASATFVSFLPKKRNKKSPTVQFPEHRRAVIWGEVGSFSRSGLSGRDTATTGEQHDGVESDSRPSQSFPLFPLLARGGLPSLQ